MSAVGGSFDVASEGALDWVSEGALDVTLNGAAAAFTTKKSERRDAGSRSGPAGNSQPLP